MVSSESSDGLASRLRGRIGVGAAVVVLVAALAVTVGIGVLRAGSAPVQQVAVTASPLPRPSPATTGGGVFVHVSGAVRTPGLYGLPAGSRLVDAVAAAGGFAADAARDGVNLARPVTDGEQIAVPHPGEQPVSVPGPVGPGATSPTGLVDLNTADEAALQQLPRIGPALSQRILQWREKNGPFTSVDDLMAVSGIGPKMMESLRDLVTV